MNRSLKANKTGIRIDAYLAENIDELSRNAIKNLIDSGKVKCNGIVCKPSLKIQEGDDILIQTEETTDLGTKAQDIPLEVLYEDQWLAVINKPKGLVVHPAPGNRDGTLVNALLNKYGIEGLSAINGPTRPGIVHRIDKDTSGLLIIARDNEAHRKLSEDISKHEVKRTYRAIVIGVIPENRGKIDLPLARDMNDRVKNAVTKKGKRAITHFKVIKRFKEATYIEVDLETGRTHQIRVHMAHIGYPLAGDRVYGRKKDGFSTMGQALHAFKLEFKHPILNRDIIIQAPLPDYFNDLLDELEKGNGQ